jgi:hypothetical protein
MKRYLGGTKVEGGYYWHLGTWEIATVKGETGTLPGTAEDKYLHVPLPLLCVAAPVMGAAFAIFLPFIGFAMPVYAIGRGIFGKGKGRKPAAAETGTVRA